MSKPNFETKLKKVESLLQNMSTQSVSIDDLAKDYQQANQLIQELISQLDSIEKDIELNESYSSVLNSEIDNQDQTC